MKLLSIKQVAEITGLSKEKIRQLVEAEIIPAKDFNEGTGLEKRLWRINESVLEKYASTINSVKDRANNHKIKLA